MTDSRTCEHIFERIRRWPVKWRWRCYKCSLLTRHYDSVDAQAGRPVHKNMSVAVKGFNTRKAPR